MATYDEQTKQQALALAEEYGSAEAARRTGVPVGTIKAWLHRAGRKVGRNPRATATAQPQQKAQPADRPQRDAKGRFLPGVSGNPSGGTSAARIARMEAERYTPRAIELLKQIAEDERQRVYARLEALRELLDRGLGRPKQAVDLDVEGVSTNVAVNILHLDATQVEAARRELLGRIDRLAAARGAMARAGEGDGNG